MPTLYEWSEDDFHAYLNAPSRRGHPRKSIGGSQVGAVCGLSRYATPATVYDDILELTPSEAPTYALRRGRALEPVAATEYETAQPTRSLYMASDDIRHDSMGCSYPDMTRPWVRVSPDRFWREIGGAATTWDGILEIKVLGERSFEETVREGIDPSYYAQLQWYLGKLGLARGAFAVLHPERWELHHFDVAFDPEFYEWVAAQVDRFWTQQVLARRRPTVNDAPNGAAPRMLPPARARGAATERVSGAEWSATVERLRAAQETKRLAETEFEHAREAMKALMERTGLPDVQYGETRVAWVPTTRRVLDEDALYQSALDRDAMEHWLTDQLAGVAVRGEARATILQRLRTEAPRLDLERCRRETTSSQFRITARRSA